MSLTLDAALGALGSVAKGAGAITAIGAFYVAVGGPMPATVSYVDAKIATVVAAVGDVKLVVLEGQLRDITAQRALLRNEQTALSRTLDKAAETAKPIFIRRMGEIDDALAKLGREESNVSTKIAQGRESK